MTASVAQNFTGSGAWYKLYPGAKAELYISPSSDLGTTFNVGDIASITYHTYNQNNAVPVDYFMAIYTRVPGSGPFAHSWYEQRLTAEPYLKTLPYVPAYNVWNAWNASGGDPLTFNDSNNSGNQGFYTAPTLAQIQAAAGTGIRWSTWPSNPTQGTANTNFFDYANQSVYLLSFQTGSGWSAFNGYLDGVTITLNNGEIYQVDLEAAAGPDNVSAAPAQGACISTPTPCVTVPVDWTRADATPARAYTVTFHLSANLTVCGAGITQGSYLSSVGGTSFQVVNHGGGSYTVDCAILGLPCGATGDGNLFNIPLSSGSPTGTGTITVDAVVARDCSNAPISAYPGEPATIPINHVAPGAIVSLSAAQQILSNPAGQTTNINLSWPSVGAGNTVQLWRKGFGNYPEYDDAPGAGSVPAAPATPTAAAIAGWAPVASLTTPTTTYTDPAGTESEALDFESYSLGSINGQDGWSRTGSYDMVVNSSLGTAGFGAKSLRISDAYTSGSFGDMTFAKPLVNAVGETAATAAAFSVGTRRTHLEVQFDLASVLPTLQAGMHVSMAPDRGDGSRMSYLRFEDQADGIHVFFDDVQGTTNPANFVETDIATLTRTPHRIRLAMTVVDGPSNDVVQVSIDGVLKITGTSWENYYRYDSEASAEQSPRIVKTVIFRTSGTAHLANLGNGFLFDNLSLSSGGTGTRDFYYYVAYVTDPCNNISAVSNRTSGTLNYHLGDVSNGTPGTGDNTVTGLDISTLGAHYGITEPAITAGGFGYLDVGPTTNFSVNARPTTDDFIGFEDLVMFAINFGQVSKPSPAASPASIDQLRIETLENGSGLSAQLRFDGTGRVQALSTHLRWNASVVQPVSSAANAWLSEQGGVAMSAALGSVDVALLGHGRGLSGENVSLATVSFRRIAEGDAGIGVATAEGRDAENRPVSLGVAFTPGGSHGARVTALIGASPNPFRGKASVVYSLARSGMINLSIYTVDGRRVKTLFSGSREAGDYRADWDGKSEQGARMSPGIYYARLRTATEGSFGRTLNYLK